MSPPTDNLYKFLAIFGLIVVGFSVYIPLQRLEALGRSNVLVDVAYGPMLGRLALVDNYERARLDCAIKDAIGQKGPDTKLGLCDKLASAKAAAAVATADLVALKGKADALVSDRNFLYQQYVMYSVIGLVLLCVGVGLCVVGFWLWYVRLQRPMDAAVRAEASSARHSQRRASVGPKPRK